MTDAGARIAARLGEWLRGQGVGDPVEALGRATVGLSQETWFVRIGDRQAVLRLPTPASGSRAILTQIGALKALRGGVPAPRILWSDPSEETPFGRPFLVMERAIGEVPVGWHSLPAPRRDRLAAEAIRAMAELHELPAPAPDGAGPSPVDLPFYERRLERFKPLPAVLRGAIWWLRRNRPDAVEPAFVHGDFRMGNMVVSGDRLVALLDWEMAGSGDPAADLAWCFVPVWEPSGVDEDALIELYGRLRGQAVDRERVRWHRVLGFVRLAYYSLAGAAAFERGDSDDFRLAALRLQLPVYLDRLAGTLAGSDLRR